MQSLEELTQSISQAADTLSCIPMIKAGQGKFDERKIRRDRGGKFGNKPGGEQEGDRSGQREPDRSPQPQRPPQQKPEPQRKIEQQQGSDKKSESSDPASDFDRTQWHGKRDDWAALPITERDRMANASNSVPNRMKELMEGMPERPSSGDLIKDSTERANQFSDRIAPEALEKIKRHITGYNNVLNGVVNDPEVRRELVLRAVESLATQDMESMTRTLGDHGIYHIGGNIDATMQMLDQLPMDIPPVERAMAYTAQIFHDSGYMADPSRAFLDEGHPRWSAQDFQINHKKLMTQAFGAEGSQYIGHIIRTHDSTEVDWERDPVTTACRVADNTALFHPEKLPPLFRHVPESMEVLKQLAAGEIDGDTAKTQCEQLVESSDLAPKVKEMLKLAALEVNPMTPKFTLGMIGGRVTGYEWTGGHMKINLEYDKTATEVNKLGDMGQRQFAKLAEAYNVDPEQFKRDLNFKFTAGGGQVLLEGDVTKIKRLIDLVTKGAIDIGMTPEEILDSITEEQAGFLLLHK